MFGKKDSQPQSPSPSDRVTSAKPGAKGRPTRSRKEAEAANRRDMIPADRKLAKQRARERRDEAWRRQQLAMDTGDERYMPARERGRARRITRDYIDSRWSIAEFVLPAMLLLIVVMLSLSLLVQVIPPRATAILVQVITYGTYVLLGASVIESVWVMRKIRSYLEEHHPNEPWPKGSWFYIFSRMVMARRWRQPKPQVKRGEFNKSRG